MFSVIPEIVNILMIFEYKIRNAFSLLQCVEEIYTRAEASATQEQTLKCKYQNMGIHLLDLLVSMKLRFMHKSPVCQKELLLFICC